MTKPEAEAKDDPEHSAEGTTFAREGPAPPDNDTGESVAEMNEAARRSIVRNIRPDENVD